MGISFRVVGEKIPWTAQPFVPPTRSLCRLAHAAQACRGCPLYVDATRTVFGEGSRAAAIVLVGEQPGDQEDRQGHPFVGPAGWARAGELAREP